jgi:hypothetical protein
VCSPFNCHHEYQEPSNQNSRYCSLLYLDIMAISTITPKGTDVIPGKNDTKMYRGAQKCIHIIPPPFHLTVLPFDKVALALM